MNGGNMSHSKKVHNPVSRNELHRLTKISLKHLSCLATQGRIPGTEKAKGRHGHSLPVPDSLELRQWIYEQQERRRPLGSSEFAQRNIRPIVTLAGRCERALAEARLRKLVATKAELSSLFVYLRPIIRYYNFFIDEMEKLKAKEKGSGL
jgi:hypothetical protein